MPPQVDYDTKELRFSDIIYRRDEQSYVTLIYEKVYEDRAGGRFQYEEWLKFDGVSFHATCMLPSCQ